MEKAAQQFDVAVWQGRGLEASAGKLKWHTVVALLIALTIVNLALFGEALAPHDPQAQELWDRLLPPAWHAAGELSHPLGTDQLGRDLFSRLIAGAQVTLLIAVIAMLLEAIVGVSVGLVAGYAGGRTEQLLMQWTEIQMGFPSLLIFMTIILAVGNSIPTIILALGINGWMIFARVTRTTVRSLRVQGFVESAIVTGARHSGTIRRHILPHLLPQLSALLPLEIARLILAESGASFLGLGVQPPMVSWGLILGASRDYIPVAYHIALFPGLAIVLTILSLNVLSSWTRERIDPLTSGRP